MGLAIKTEDHVMFPKKEMVKYRGIHVTAQRDSNN